MRVLLIFICCFFCGNTSFSQNLVQNGSFEFPALGGCSFGTNCIIPDWTLTGCVGTPNQIIPACGSGNPNPSDGIQALQS